MDELLNILSHHPQWLIELRLSSQTTIKAYVLRFSMVIPTFDGGAHVKRERYISLRAVENAKDGNYWANEIAQLELMFNDDITDTLKKLKEENKIP